MAFPVTGHLYTVKLFHGGGEVGGGGGGGQGDVSRLSALFLDNASTEAKAGLPVCFLDLYI